MPCAVFAETWDEIRFQGLADGISYPISMGTGFFINREDIVTNRHVVENCRNIAIRGAVQPTLVKLLFIDHELDLAVLRSPVFAKKAPYLRSNQSSAQTGDMLFSIGYPLERGSTGKYIIKKAQILNLKSDDLHHIEFTDNVNHGNSGGPLLDKNSNLVGVVTAKLTYKYDNPSTPQKHVAFAIGVDGLIAFLKKFHIPYASSATYDIFTNYHVDRLVKDYVVNIHCVHNPR